MSRAVLSLSDVEVGQELPPRTTHISRATLVQYAGASLDRNRIHWDEAFARSVGLPDVIAHGMFTMGSAVQLVSDWAQDPGAVIDYQTRFTKPVPVADPAGSNPSDFEGTAIEISGTIGALDAEARTARVDLTVSVDGTKVLIKAQAVVQL